MTDRFSCILRAFRDHEGELRGYLQHRTGDAHLAGDLLQEVFLKAMRQGQDFCALDNSRAWLFQVARNTLADHLRLDRETVGLPDELPAEVRQTEAVVALSACVARVLSELAPDDRDIIEQCDLEGMRQQEYATRHELTLAATKSRLLRARQRMREHMSAACQVQFDASGRVAGHVPRK